MKILPNHPAGLDELTEGQKDWLSYNYGLQAEATQKVMDENLGKGRALRSFSPVE